MTPRPFAARFEQGLGRLEIIDSLTSDFKTTFITLTLIASLGGVATFLLLATIVDVFTPQPQPRIETEQLKGD